MELLDKRYSITELSVILGVTDHTLRYYEKEFKLNVPKDSRGRRYYTIELSNSLRKIKAMRDDGMEIKSIKKVLQPDTPIDLPSTEVSDKTFLPLNYIDKLNDKERTLEIRQLINDLKNYLTEDIINEVINSKEQLSKEITKTKLELGACFENNLRKLETKMDNHFKNVDTSISTWRQKKEKSNFRRVLNNIFK